MNQPQPLLAVKDVSEILGVTVQCLYQWAMKGKGPSIIKIGGSNRYRMSDIDEYINANTSHGGTNK